MTTPIFLAPGTICCAAEPSVVTTILGSCVAVCLFDRHRRIGGMNHFLLPRCGPSPPTARYGDVAFARLLAAMERLGSRPVDLRAKVFGGAAVLPFGARADTVGTQNVAVALEALLIHGIPVMARRTGGLRGLFLRFHTANGRVTGAGTARREQPRGRRGPGREPEREPERKSGLIRGAGAPRAREIALYQPSFATTLHVMTAPGAATPRLRCARAKTWVPGRRGPSRAKPDQAMPSPVVTQS